MNDERKPWTFTAFQAMNNLRCQSVWPEHNDWPIQNWALAIAGEAGEMCNLVKKVIRGDFPLESVRQDVLKELADIITYADLAMTCLGADTERELLEKFDEVSRRVNWHPTRSRL